MNAARALLLPTLCLSAACNEGGIAASTGGGESPSTSSGQPPADAGPGCNPPDTPPSDGGCMIPGGQDSGLPDGSSCNPVTAEPCDVDAGAACDDLIDPDGTLLGFECYPPPNDVALCAPCNYDQGRFCVAGSTCLAGRCLRFCCSVEDCAGADCVKSNELGKPLFSVAPNLGVCSSL